jgi:glycine dehydrogenase subunit 1
MSMSYLPNTPEDREKMLATIGAASIDELFALVPDELRLHRELNLPPALSELELTTHLSRLASRNRPAGQGISFLGAGSYDHFIPATVDAIASRGEFFTSYTPYQAEASQGNLQAAFEYQTLITQLTGMDVSNASLYDGGSAAAEAVLMSCHATGRRRVVLAASVHPEYRDIIAAYLRNTDIEIVTLPTTGGVIETRGLESVLNDQVACLLVQQPNFFGCLEDVDTLVHAARSAGAMFVVAVDPISLGLLKRPGEYDADIAIAEGQSLGNPMAYGGPYLGIMAVREGLMRRMPGRLAGETSDRRGQRCWVLTLQTREQHIRREKATSNICTNQGLLALRASVYLALMGPHGMREAAELCLRKAHYAQKRVTACERFSPAFGAPFFKEFVIRDDQGDVEDLLAGAAAQGVLAGLPLGRWYPELDDCFLVAVTEKRSREEIDLLARTLASAELPTVAAGSLDG